MRKLFSILILFFCVSSSYADIKLPALVGDNMVLQQKTSVKIWGWSKSNTKVSVATSWDKKSYDTKSNKDGEWQLTIGTPAAGGPYGIKINDGKDLTLRNILIGEVWLCSGQSNMEMALRGNSSGLL